MRKFVIVLFATIAISGLWLSFPPKNSAYIIDSGAKDRLVVKFYPLIPKAIKNMALGKYGLILKEEVKLPDSFIVEVPKGKISEYKENLKKNLLVDYVEEDYQATEFEIPNDSFYSNQWGLDKVQAPDAWNISHGSNNIDIAIIDTGINYKHPDLGSRVTLSVDCRTASCPIYWTQDPDGHGTHVAGIAGAITNNNLGVAGISWDANLFSIKVLNDSGVGYYSWIANGIVWAADNGAEVINLSLGGSNPSNTLASAIDYAWSKGAVIVVAAGNNGANSPTYPAYYTNSIAVAAVSQNDAKASFSNYGTWVDVAAPGSSIFSTYQNGYGYLSGTSMASPFVSGLAALIKAANPSFNNVDIRQKIESSADAVSGTGSYWVYGRINACKALGCIELTPSPTLTPSSVPTLVPSITLTPIPTLTSVPTSNPTPTQILPTPTPTFIPTPTPSTPLPWWCRYIPSHPTCQK